MPTSLVELVVVIGVSAIIAATALGGLMLAPDMAQERYRQAVIQPIKRLEKELSAGW
jgi:type II secretory pathway pseudopilin PulG